MDRELSSTKYGIPKSASAQCQYGGEDSMALRCEVIVGPYQGWREYGMVYCTADHAAEDQEMYIM